MQAIETRLSSFKERLAEKLFAHLVITSNPYTKWFKQGRAGAQDVKDLLVQFSVFSNHFIVIQAKRMVFAAGEEAERAARYILVSECGVGLDPRTGSSEGKTFSTGNAHINWLRDTASALGIEPRSLGRWELAAPSTRVFLKGLERSYASPNDSIGAGASFAIENWAAFGIGEGEALESNNFWRELIDGLEGFNARERRPKGLSELAPGFFKYHFQLEKGHAANVWNELEKNFSNPGFNEEKFLKGGLSALNAIHAFWLGLDERRRLKNALNSSAAAALGRERVPRVLLSGRNLNLDILAQNAQSWAR